MSRSRCSALPAAAGLVLVVLLGTAQGQAPDPRWTVDYSRSSVGFSVTKLGFSDVSGRFTDFTATVTFDPAQPARSSVAWDVHVASVQTDSADRDRSLMAPEYFDATRHAAMTFRSQAIRRLDDGRLEVAGVLTIKGHSEPLTVMVSPIDRGFETRFEVDRMRFNVRGGTVMSRLIGRTVRVHLIIRSAGTTTAPV
jgi:polyisoprenoid-binding protein YceI